MKAILIGALAVGLLLASVGCAPNPRIGNGITASERVFGDYGITGHNCNLTMLRGSKCTKLSVIGDNNTITVEDGAMLYRIEFWGKGNIVSVPETLLILRTTEVGANQLIRRPVQPRTEEFPMTYYPPPTEATPAPKGQPTAPPRTTMEPKPLPPEADVMENQGTEEK
jgi:hypothetical protein